MAENRTDDHKFGGNNYTSMITYDHLGNHFWLGRSDIKYIISKVSVVWNHYGLILQLDIYHVNTESRIFIAKASKQTQIHWYALYTGMDNRADTIFFGSNIKPISFKSEECTIAPFLVEYSKHVNIPIHTGMTSYKMESGGGHNIYNWPRVMV